ncbi:hypothetical protein ADICYQ_3727 [Cyclobacterium qasimii M12-11B]|uniref:Uncharacterized protein n=1 Tax=Cyclobacterium qasimii M12-11B TaxID=641524 RepID=S7VC83_9BACT|nr:hypothetical protein ADICYQ_3727 [Cyclobacterium qasimii M12-11B]
MGRYGNRTAITGFNHRPFVRDKNQSSLIEICTDRKQKRDGKQLLATVSFNFIEIPHA